MDPVGSITIRYWGTRGSVPTPGPETVRYGGNTSCVELVVEGRRIILDAGTGILGLGKSLGNSAHWGDGAGGEATLLLTHFHWDHIQGLPFFGPAYNPRYRLRIVAPDQEQGHVESIVRQVMGPVYFPLPWEALEARLTFFGLNEGEWKDGNLTIRPARMRHNDFTVGYRIETTTARIVYIPDNELVGGPFPVPPDWRQGMRDFVSGADLLIHDGMFTEEEYADRAGWGHSTFDQALDLAIEAGVKNLHFFHHSPERSDEDLDRILGEMRETVGNRAPDLTLEAAAEGMHLNLG